MENTMSPPMPCHAEIPRVAFTTDVASKEAFAVQDVPAGKGLMAVRPIVRGEIILSETPLFTQTTTRNNSAILVALSRCTRDQQREFFTLSNIHKGTLLPALGIFETNALPCAEASQGAGKALSRAGVFLVASRINSSCAPNVIRSWDPKAQVMVFRALRDIEPDEELCMNYGYLLGTREQRQRELKEKFGFWCNCSVCSLEGDALQESDNRRATIKRLFDEIGGCGKEPTLGMRKVQIALQCLKEEDLVHYEASFYFDAFQFCVLVSDYANAKAWIRKAWEAMCFTSGPESDSARMFKMYWANPRAHRFAGALPRMTLSGPN